MLFNSWQFIFAFLPVTLAVLNLIPASRPPARKVWLIFASLAFYAFWKPEYVLLLAASIAGNFCVSRTLSQCRRTDRARLILALGVSANVLLLGYFKYAGLMVELAHLLTGHPVPVIKIILPLAISFFTFTQIAYLVDVYRHPGLHYPFLDYTLFVVFFPHLIAGPILRHWEIIPQFQRTGFRVDSGDASVGLTLFICGLVKKILLADSVMPFANSVYAAAEAGQGVDGFTAWLGTLAFGLQIYFDFSGYSDMAIGLARLFGIRFPVNFNSPYVAVSIIDFWRRWHITLSRFLREYIYFPLGGNRCGGFQQAANLLATMLISGLWHGAAWTFVIWGGIHGLFMLVARGWRLLVKNISWFNEELKPWRLAARILTFGAVTLAWPFFRASNTAVALHLSASMLGWNGFHSAAGLPGFDYSDAVKIIGPVLLLAVAFPNTQELLCDFHPVLETISSHFRFRMVLNARWGFALGLVSFLALHAAFHSGPSPFIYFNF